MATHFIAQETSAVTHFPSVKLLLDSSQITLPTTEKIFADPDQPTAARPLVSRLFTSGISAEEKFPRSRMLVLRVCTTRFPLFVVYARRTILSTPSSMVAAVTLTPFGTLPIVSETK